MKKTFYSSETRGKADHGWLKANFSFSFAQYFDPSRIHFGALRVLNDDYIQPKMGFGTHPHQNMEIISIPLQGALSHKDSMGNQRAIEVGEIQVMSAGSGITHSEFNDSKTDITNLLQLWIVPEVMNITPQYDQRVFSELAEVNTLHTLAAPYNKLVGNALPIHQQGYIKKASFTQHHEIDYKPEIKENGAYLFLINGQLSVDGVPLNKRDAIGLEQIDNVKIKAEQDSEFIIVEVPMITLN